MRPKLSKFEYREPIFRVISKIKARKGQYFLARAVKEGIKELPNDVGFSLQRFSSGKVTWR